MRTRSRRRIDALEAQVLKATEDRDRLRRRQDALYAALRAVGQHAGPDTPDERDVAIVKITAALATLSGPGWVPVPVTVRGQQVIVLVCNCEQGDPEEIYQAARQLTRPLRAVKAAV